MTRNCSQCGGSVPADHRFCGHCGARMEVMPARSNPGGERTMFFGAMQAPGRAKLILIKGDALDGISYHLSGSEHGVGRSDGAILFPEDPFLSPNHASFNYRSDGRLVVKDMGSRNGVFLRIRQPTTLPTSSIFLVGEQLLQIDTMVPPESDQEVDGEGTYFYASPHKTSRLKLTQRLRGGESGIIFRATGDVISVGREGCDINFPNDPFLSGRHAEVSYADQGTFVLTDMGSKNGTFYRIGNDELVLAHGDYVFLGQQLLRVEIS